MNKNEPLKIGLLLCDDVDESVQEIYGTYSEMFQSSLDPTAQIIELVPIRCFEGEHLPNPKDYDGYIISGSRHGVYDDLPWISVLQQFIQDCWDQEVKMVGICFGHQLLAHSLGGKAEKADIGWGFGIHSTKITDKKPWMTDTEDLNGHLYNLIVIHQDQVVEIPPNFKTIGENDFCPNSMIVADSKMLGIQGHPEFSKEFCAFRADFRRNLIGPEVYESTLRSLESNDTHSNTVMIWIKNFLRI